MNASESQPSSHNHPDVASLAAAYHQICLFTLSLQDQNFVHQHVVDAYAAQMASLDDKPIKLTFALVGLYLHIERQFTGRQVQWAHMKMANRSKEWPIWDLPTNRGAHNAIDVCHRLPHDGIGAIDDWCRAVWNAFSHHRDPLQRLLTQHEIYDARSVQRRT